MTGKQGFTVEAWAPVAGGEGGGVCLPGHEEELPGRRIHSLATGWKVSITLNIKGQCHEIFDLRFSVDAGRRGGGPAHHLTLQSH
jgi:hypothetical protein